VSEKCCLFHNFFDYIDSNNAYIEWKIHSHFSICPDHILRWKCSTQIASPFPLVMVWFMSMEALLGKLESVKYS
jgi:hypothetical protein